MDAETVAQSFLQRKFLRTLESFSGRLDGLDPRGNKSADVFARVVEGKEIPFAVDVRQMIRVNDARFGFRLAGLAIGQFQLLPSRGGLGERVKNFQIQNRFGARAEGNRLLDVGEVERNGVGQRLLHFFDRAQQRFLKTRAAILLQALFPRRRARKFRPR